MNGMDLVFNTKDLIYIISMVVGGLTAWFKLKMDKQKLEAEMKVLEAQVGKNEGTMFKKFSNVHARMDKNEEQNKTEFNAINSNMSEIKSNISSINGKLDILINK